MEQYIKRKYQLKKIQRRIVHVSEDHVSRINREIDRIEDCLALGMAGVAKTFCRNLCEQKECSGMKDAFLEQYNMNLQMEMIDCDRMVRGWGDDV